MLICIFTGFASGMPLYVLISLVPAWLRTEGVGLKEIGLFSLIGLPYVWKFLWSPLLDRYSLPLLFYRPGLRRSWMLSTQLLLLITLAMLGFLDPLIHLWYIAWLCLGIAFLSATQDIVLDAYRRQILPDQELGLGNSIHVNAYRVAGLVPGSLSFILSDFLPWNIVFVVTSAFVLVGIILTLSVSEPTSNHNQPATLRAAIIDPFDDFLSRQGVKQAFLILIFMLLYKLGDSMATALATPFYLDMGYSKTEIGFVAKNAALWPMIIGGISGGILMLKIGINRALWLFGFVQIVSILGFALLARIGEGLWLLGLVIGFEYLGVGLGTAAFVAFIARTTNPAFAATQFALFTALTAVPRTIASATTGIIVESIGWENFFYLCTLIAVPGMILLIKVAPWSEKTNQSTNSDLK
jgi:PAT family beta-lactamase induction signal transducer AmpG|tara:strand:- start:9945 stop:11177 length:1233 start_codon:yes stop_codon:yes gene_type:complete